MTRGLPAWVANPWLLRLAVLLLGLACLAARGTLAPPDLAWFDQSLRWRERWAPPLSSRIVHLDVTPDDLKNWPDAADEIGALAGIVEGLRGQGAQVIGLDVLLLRGKPSAFARLKAVAAGHDDLVLGATLTEHTPVPGTTGLVYAIPDPDGVQRRYQLAFPSPDGSFQPSLALALYLKLTGIDWSVAGSSLRLQDATEGGDPWDRRLPLEPMLDWRHPWERSFYHLSPRQLEDNPDPTRLAGKVVLIGYLIGSDQGATPLSNSSPKVFIHSMALNDLIQDSWHTPASPVLQGVGLVLLWALGWGLTLRLRPLHLAGAWLAGSALLLGGGLELIWHSHLVPGLVSWAAMLTASMAAERWRLGNLRDMRQVAVLATADMEDPLVLKLVGDYQLVQKIGQGGFASVYRALEHRTLDPASAVAIKIVHQASADNPEFRRRFLREIRINAALAHPNVVRVIDEGDQNGLLYLAMELLKGRPLRAFMTDGVPWSLEDTRRAMGPIMAAMTHAHGLGVLHRDLKPENVMAEEGLQNVKVVDFGLAFDAQSSRITKSGDVCGTLDYLAPECIEGKGDDPRSDQYSLGVLTYELLAGQIPFPGLTPGEAIMKRLSKDAPRLSTLRDDLPEPVVEAVARMLARDPAARFPTVAEAWKALV